MSNRDRIVSLNAAGELSRAEIARAVGVSRQRVLQILGPSGGLAYSTGRQEPIAGYLLAHMGPTTVTGCREWQLSRNPVTGYGHLNRKGTRQQAAHRAVYETFVGPIPEGLHICHTCDNPPCCEPSHLFPGTAADNMHDRDRKGRGRTGSSVKPLPLQEIAQ